MALRQGLLGLLNYGEMTGYELAKAFNDSLSYFWQAQTSQIYRELNQMEALGWLQSRIEVQADKPNKRVYSITPAGTAQLHRWLESELPAEMMPTRSEVLLRLFFSAKRPPQNTIESLQQLAQAYQAQLRQMERIGGVIAQYQTLTQASRDALYWEMTADFGLAYSRMCLDWVYRCIERLKDDHDENAGA